MNFTELYLIKSWLEVASVFLFSNKCFVYPKLVFKLLIYMIPELTTPNLAIQNSSHSNLIIKITVFMIQQHLFSWSLNRFVTTIRPSRSRRPFCVGGGDGHHTHATHKCADPVSGCYMHIRWPLHVCKQLLAHVKPCGSRRKTLVALIGRFCCLTHI